VDIADHCPLTRPLHVVAYRLVYLWKLYPRVFSDYLTIGQDVVLLVVALDEFIGTTFKACGLCVKK
jgi:hypothetical protein